MTTDLPKPDFARNMRLALPNASFIGFNPRNGRDQPRHSVVRHPPGANRRDLMPTQPIDLIVRATYRPEHNDYILTMRPPPSKLEGQR